MNILCKKKKKKQNIVQPCKIEFNDKYYLYIAEFLPLICGLVQGVEGCGMLKERDHSSFFTQCSVLTRRSLLNMSRDMGYYWLRLAIYIILNLGLGTIFYDIGSTYGSIQVRVIAHGSSRSTSVVFFEELHGGFIEVIRTVENISTGKRSTNHVHSFIPHFYDNWWIPIFCGGHEGVFQF